MIRAAAGDWFAGSILKVGASLCDAVFPTRCCGCGKFYHREGQDRRIQTTSNPVSETAIALERLSAFLCRTCLQKMRTPEKSSICTHCGRRFESSETVAHLCGCCQQKPFAFSMARSTGKYDDILKSLICKYKYEWCSELGDPLARLLWQALVIHWSLDEFDCVVPVPLHLNRIRKRGFNQAAHLIRQWPRIAREQGVALPPDYIRDDILIRCRPTPPQTGLGRDQRSANMRHAFKLTGAASITGLCILLVDDVLTTGATANACTRVLKAGKASDVKVLTLARAF